MMHDVIFGNSPKTALTIFTRRSFRRRIFLMCSCKLFPLPFGYWHIALCPVQFDQLLPLDETDVLCAPEKNYGAYSTENSMG